jgi:hypothetical protein
MQMRALFEAQNLRFNAEKKRFELPFDPAELADFSFSDSPHLGKPKLCLPKSPERPLDPHKATELVYKSRLQQDFGQDPSGEIVSRVNQVLAFGSVSAEGDEEG